jgi:hypothetical protein
LFYPTCHVGPEKADRISLSEGLNRIETALTHIEQQREVTITDILLFRHWHDFAANESKKV